MKNRLQFKTLIARFVILLLLVALTACSKTVQWEEEVPLNTGDVIWIKRTVTYKFDVTHDNPFVPSYVPRGQETRVFTWRGKQYSHTGSGSLELLAISPVTNEPVLVAFAVNVGWDTQHNYQCTDSFYVQFSPDATGSKWDWPPKIEPWLYGLPHNLMRHRPDWKRDTFREKYSHLEISRIEGWASGSNFVKPKTLSKSCSD